MLQSRKPLTHQNDPVLRQVLAIAPRLTTGKVNSFSHGLTAGSLVCLSHGRLGNHPRLLGNHHRLMELMENATVCCRLTNIRLAADEPGSRLPYNGKIRQLSRSRLTTSRRGNRLDPHSP